MHSRVHENEKITSEAHKLGSAPCYYPALLVLPSGDEEVLLFSNDQVNVARHRATQHPDAAAELVAAGARAEWRIHWILIGCLAVSALIGAIIVALWP